MNPEFVNLSSPANFSLVFKAEAVPALGFKTYFVTKQSGLLALLRGSEQQRKTTRVQTFKSGILGRQPPPPEPLALETDVRLRHSDTKLRALTY